MCSSRYATRAFEPRAGVERAVEVDAVRRQRVGQRGAVAVGQPAHGVGLEAPGGGAGAEQAAPEARALLVGPVHELEREPARLRGERAQHLEPGDDVQRPVEPAAARHRVQVPADDHELVGLAGRRRPRVARLVGLDGHAVDRVELRAQPLARRDPRVRPRDPLGAVVVPGPAAQLLQPLDRARGVDGGHQRTAGPGAGCENDRRTNFPEPAGATTSPSR